MMGSKQSNRQLQGSDRKRANPQARLTDTDLLQYSADRRCVDMRKPTEPLVLSAMAIRFLYLPST